MRCGTAQYKPGQSGRGLTQPAGTRISNATNVPLDLLVFSPDGVAERGGGGDAAEIGRNAGARAHQFSRRCVCVCVCVKMSMCVSNG